MKMMLCPGKAIEKIESEAVLFSPGVGYTC